MSDFDIANLGTQAVDDGNEAPSEFYRPPDPGKATIMLKEMPADEKFYGLKDYETQQTVPGFSVNAQWEVKGGASDGQSFFAFIDTRKKGQDGAQMSLVKQYLLAAGYTGPLSTVQDYKDAVQQTIAPVPVKLTWEVRKCECGAKKLKLKDLPFKADGKTRDHEVKCPECGDKRGAQIKIAAFIIDDAKAA